MLYLLPILFVLLFCLVWPSSSKQQRQQLIIWVTLAIVVLLAFTGRAHWLSALVVGVIALLDKLSRLAWVAEKLTFLNKTKKTPSSPQMTLEQAAQLLGVAKNASTEEIVFAHKKLMQKVHPDRGGTDALASQINQAKKILLAANDEK